MGNIGPLELLVFLLMLVIAGGALFGIIYFAVRAANKRK